jgi:hypothetical protein
VIGKSSTTPSVPRRRISSISAAVIAVLLVSAGIALASIPDADGSVQACYSNTSGQVRLVNKEPTDCDAGETGISWSQTGPQGPAGPLGYVVVTGPASASDSAPTKSAAVSCPSGKVVLGGGGVLSSSTSTNALAVTQSAASADGSKWTVKAVELRAFSGSWSVKARAQCATATPTPTPTP